MASKRWEPSGARQREALTEGNVFSFHWEVVRKRLAGLVTGREAPGCHKQIAGSRLFQVGRRQGRDGSKKQRLTQRQSAA